MKNVSELTELPEILLIDKPYGITSFDVIRRLRKWYTASHDGAKAPKMGHAGTLDPAATGLMILGVGAGTKQLTEYIKLDKEYIAEVVLGESRSTGDLEGEILETADEVTVAEEDVCRVVREMEGLLTLPVSAYSAIKKDGVPMYKRARAAAKIGELVDDVPFRDMRVYKAELLDMYNKDVRGNDRIVCKIRFSVGSGTYIRSLGEELGRQLGYPATLASLRRTEIGLWSVQDAYTLPERI